MCDESQNECGCCANVHFGALLNQTSRVIRRALDARISQRDIEQWFNIRRSSVTAMLQGMEQDGFITRCAVEKDARLKRLVATDKGRACHEQIEACIAQFEDDLQAGIDPQQTAAARAVLELTLKNAQHILEEGNITQERGNTTC